MRSSTDQSRWWQVSLFALGVLLLLAGTASAAPPAIVSIYANDPDDMDTTLSNGDELIIKFDMPTNQPMVATTGDVNGLLDFGVKSLGTMYMGSWYDSRTLVINIQDATGGNVVPTDQVTIIADGTWDLQNQEETSGPSTDLGIIGGNWGLMGTTPSILAAIANDPDDMDNTLGMGDTFTIEFDVATSQPSVATKAEVDVLISFSNLHTLSNMASGYGGFWASPTRLEISIWDIGGDVDVASDSVFINVGANLKDYSGTSGVCTDSSTITGDWGLAGTVPSIMMVMADDPDNMDTVLGMGDTLTIIFDINTNTPMAATAFDIEQFISFTAGHTLGTSYSGTWENPKKLRINTMDSDGNVDLGDTLTIGGGLLKDASGWSVACTDSSAISGDWGVVPPAPSIISAVGDDPDDMDSSLSTGDKLTITFDINTNQPAVATSGDIDNLMEFAGGARYLGTSYWGWWVTPKKLEISVSDGGGASVLIGDNVTILAAGNLKDSTGASAASTDSRAITGDWGLAGTVPSIMSIVADDPDDLDGTLSSGDELIITFDINTNQPTVATKANIDALINFGGKSLGTSYTGWWFDQKTIEINVSDATGADLAISDTISIRAAGNLKDFSGNSAACTDSGVVSGDWGEAGATPQIADVVADDPDDGDTFLGMGDTLTITFDIPTNTPPVSTETMVDSLISFTGGHTLGGTYGGVWENSMTLRIDVWTGAGTVTLSDMVTILGTGNLMDSSGTSAACTDSAAITGDWGQAGTTPILTGAVANDPDDLDGVLGIGDTFTLTFDADTNMPVAATTGDIDAIISFSGGHKLGTTYYGSWTNSRTLKVTVSTGAGNVLLSDTVSILAGGNLRDSSGTSAACTDTLGLTGDWGQAGGTPNILTVIADDPDDLDSVLSIGDTITITFDADTNQPPVSTQAMIDALVAYSNDHTFGSTYWAQWLDARTLKIELTTAPGDILLTDSVEILAGGNLKDSSGTSSACTDIMGITGNWGQAASAPAIVSVVADDPDDLDTYLSSGDKLTITFDINTNQPTVTTMTMVDMLVDFGGKSLGTYYMGWWQDAKTLVIDVSDGAGGTLVPGNFVSIVATGGLKNSTSTSPACSDSMALTGDWGQTTATPSLTSVIADDPDDLDAVLSNGDTLTLRFDINTNQPVVATMGDVNNLLDFGGKVLGAYYTGWWKDARTIEINVSDATGGTLSPGHYVTIRSSGNLRNSTSTSPACTDSMGITGDWGNLVAIPQILSVTADDPDDLDAVLSNGDTLKIKFDINTNQPTVTTMAMVDSLIDFGAKSLGTYYMGWWQDPRTLVIDISDAAAGTLSISDTIWIKATGNLKNAAGTSAACSDSGTVSGDWGSMVAIPQIVSVTADDPDDLDAVLSNGDTLTITFDINTNQPPMATMTDVNGLIDFGGKTLGTYYTAWWKDPKTIEINISDAIAGTLAISDTIWIKADGTNDLMNAAATSPACTASGGVSGDWGTTAAIPQIISVVADDPDDLDGVLSSGDTLKIKFDINTNQPTVTTMTMVDSLLDFGAKSLGTYYMGWWQDPRTLIIDISDATAGTLAISDPIWILAGGNLKNAAGTSSASTASGTVSGDWGSTVAIPQIVSVTADDPDDLDTWLSDGDTLKIRFDINTNQPPMATMSDVNGLIDFGGKVLGTYYNAWWDDPRTIVINVMDATAGTLAISDSIFIIADGTNDLKNAAGSGAASTASGTVSGDWGSVSSTPQIVSVVADDPDDLDGVLSSGDRLTITFDINTNQPTVTTMAMVDGLIDFGAKSLGGYYMGWWQDSRILIIDISDAAGGDLAISDPLWVLAGGNLKNAAGSSPASTASGTVSGDWGSTVAIPQIVSVTADDPDDLDTWLSDGDMLKIRFDINTNQPPMATMSDVNGLIDFGGKVLGTYYNAWWEDPRTIVINVMDATAGTLMISDSIFIIADDTNDLKNAAGSSSASTASGTVGGDWGSMSSTPQIVSVVADDPDDLDGVLSDGDALKIKFDINTNQPTVTTMTMVDSLIDFGAKSLGTYYMGWWQDPQTLIIDVMDAAAGTLAISDPIWIKTAGNLRNAAGTSSASSASGTVSGDWGSTVAIPQIVSVTADDPDDLDSVLSDGDMLKIRFDTNTNQPPMATMSDVNGLIDFGGKVLGTFYAAWWEDPRTIVINIMDATAGTLMISDSIFIIADGTNDLKNAAGSGSASTASGVVSGDWGSISSTPQIMSVVADDPDDLDAVLSSGDKLTITFDINTNQPPVSTMAMLDSLISFGGKMLGTYYMGWWQDSRTLVIDISDATAATLMISDPVWIMAAGNLKNASGTSPASTASGVVAGDWGSTSATPQILAVIADDPDDLDGVLSDGDTLKIKFDTNTNQPPMATMTDVDGLIDFGGKMLGTYYTAWWQDSRTIMINVMDATAGTLMISDSIFIKADGTNDLTNSSGTGTASTASGVVMGDWGSTSATPQILSVVADDPDDLDATLSSGDVLRIEFDINTNQPPVSTMAMVDSLIDFGGKSLGTYYMAWWWDPRTLIVDVMDATAGTLAISDPIRILAAGNLRNSAGTSQASTAAGTVSGDWGSMSSTPQIVSVTADDPDDLDAVLSNGDVLKIEFDINTNQPPMATTSDVNNLIDFGGKVLGTYYYAWWMDPRTIEINIMDATAGTLMISDPIFIKSTGNLKNASGTSQASVSSGVVTGDWGGTSSTPQILAVTADDPDDLDSVLSNGDMLKIKFDINTNQPPVSTMAMVDSLIDFGAKSLGAYYMAWWMDPRTLVVDVMDATAGTLAISDPVRILATGNLRNASGTGSASTAAGVVSGDWGKTSTVPQIMKVMADDPDDFDTVLSDGDMLRIEFDINTNQPPLATMADVNALIDFGGKVLGTYYHAWWMDPRTIEISIMDAAAGTLMISDSIFIKAAGNLKNSTGTSQASTASGVVTGDWGSTSGTPRVMKVIADDHDDLDTVLSSGDSLRIEFDVNTNQPPLATMTNVNSLVDFGGKVLGTYYMGWWWDPRTLVIDIMDATAGTLAISDPIWIKSTGDLRNSTGTSQPCTDSGIVMGDWGSVSGTPQLMKVIADDPDDRDIVLSSGDTLRIEFDVNTNQPPVSTMAMVDSLIDFGGKSLGAYYMAWWWDPRTLMVDIMDATGATLMISDPIYIKAAGNLKNSAGTSQACTDSGIVMGDWGKISGTPRLMAVTADDPDDLDTALSDGDMLRIEFDVNTNQPPMATMADVNGLIDFGGKVLGAYYYAWWWDAKTIEIHIMDATGGTLAISDPITIKADGTRDLKNSAGTSLPCNDTGIVMGDWGTTAGTPRVVSVIADDPDDLDTVLSSGDRLTITFDTNTNQPMITTMTMLDDLVDFGGKVLGTYYMAWWMDARTLEIEIMDATGGTLAISDPVFIVADGTDDLMNAAGTGQPCTDTAIVSGDWGSTGSTPKIEKIIADDPDDLDEVLSDGDILRIVFDSNTNQPPMATKTDVDGLIDFGGKSLGTWYHAWWMDPMTLEIYVMDSTGGNLAIADPIFIIADGTFDLKNSAGAGVASTSSGTVSGDWGIAAAIPFIDEVVADDPDDLDTFLSTGDTLTITFDTNTNQPAVGTTADVFGLIDFGGKSLGTSYVGVWTDSKTLTISVTDGTGGTLSTSDSIFVKSDGTNDLTNAAGTSPASMAYGIVTGNWGSTTAIPTLVDVEADDPDDADNMLSNNDTLTLTFDTNTNQPLVDTKSDVDGLVDWRGKSLGTDYTGKWLDAKTLKITVVDATAGTLTVSDTLFILADGTYDLKNAWGTSSPSQSQGMVTGDWGDTMAVPNIEKVEADDPDDADTVFSDGDTITITFDTNTNEPPVATMAEVDGLISFGSKVLGADYAGSWITVRKLQITINDITGGTIAVSDSIRVLADGTDDLMNTAEVSMSSTSSGVITGDWGSVSPPPNVVSVVADDPDDADEWLSAGDTLTLLFDANTNQPAVATTADIDGLIDFGDNLLGADYSGSWINAQTLRITISDATGGTVQIGQGIFIKEDGTDDLKNSNSSSLACTSYSVVTGDWGGVPYIVSVVANDPADFDTWLGMGDTLTITFGLDTNQPTVATTADIDGLIDFGGTTLGMMYMGTWLDARTLEIMVMDMGGTLAIGDAITILADGTNDLTNAAGTSIACIATGIITGDWGAGNLLDVSSLYASSGASSTAIYWGPSLSIEAVGYKVYESSDGGSTYKVPVTVGNVRSYAVWGTSPTSTYTFKVTTYDAQGAETNGSVISIVAGASATASKSVTGGTTVTDYTMISMPFVPDESILSQLSSVCGPYNPMQWRLFRREGSEYQEGRNAEPSRPGHAYWLICRNTVTIDLSGYSVDDEASYVVRLHPGFNQIANPYSQPVAWADVRVEDEGMSYSIVDPANMITERTLWEYGTGGIYSAAVDMVPTEGYWVKNIQTHDVMMVVYAPPVAPKPTDGYKAELALAFEDVDERPPGPPPYLGSSSRTGGCFIGTAAFDSSLDNTKGEVTSAILRRSNFFNTVQRRRAW
ncbi:hypothetical protein ACFL01_00920 [Planctomycetota bacterium]